MLQKQPVGVTNKNYCIFFSREISIYKSSFANIATGFLGEDPNMAGPDFIPIENPENWGHVRFIGVISEKFSTRRTPYP